MIKEFNKNGAVALYKRGFAECLEMCDYEGAIDNLLKFSEAKDNPDFHAAMGILYLLFTQDSDDKELLPLAFREFMMHLITHPDSRVTYRNLLALAILRRDATSIAETSDFISKRGYSVQELVDELSEFGLDIFNDDNDFIDFDGMFLPSDFGEIAEYVVPLVDETEEPAARVGSSGKKQAPRQKIIKFKGNSGKDAATAPRSDDKKIIRINSDSEEEKIDFGDMFDMMMQLIRSEGEIPKDDVATAVEMSGEDAADLRAKLALRDAQEMCAHGKFDEALQKLDTIRRDSERLYYCAECMRANILIEQDKFDEAQAAIDRAFSVTPDGALVGTIQCSLYEATKEYDKIPDVLKQINVADYLDSDHVCRALDLAIEYCTPDDAMSLAQEYVEEFNSLDLRSVYAQMQYNSGDRAAAVKELRTISRILYDDFNAQYYYLIAKAGLEKMPLELDTPQNILGMVVDNTIALAHSDLFTANSEILESEPFKYGLEVFLTLEFSNTKTVMRLMFDTLNILAQDRRLETTMRNALVSPYVERFVKAVILGKLLGAYKGKTEFLIEYSYYPISGDDLPAAGENRCDGYYTAYALCLFFCNRALPFLAEYYKKAERILSGSDFLPRDVAYILWRTVKAKFKLESKEAEDRLHIALGYDTKTQANAVYKQASKLLPKP